MGLISVGQQCLKVAYRVDIMMAVHMQCYVSRSLNLKVCGSRHPSPRIPGVLYSYIKTADDYICSLAPEWHFLALDPKIIGSRVREQVTCVFARDANSCICKICK